MGPKKDSEYVCKSEILAMFEDMKKYFTDQLATLLLPINTEIASLKSELRSRDVAISALQTEVAAVKSANDELMSVNKKLEEKLSDSEKFQSTVIESFIQLEEKLEDRTNRQLRQTIVVKGLPEKPSEKWADTRNILAKYIAKAYDMEFRKAYSLFERVHRGGGNGFEEKEKRKRDIYALCSHWDDSEHLVWKSYIVNKSRPKKERVVIEYKYGPLTTLRRGEAMKKRREILESKEYRNAYIKFPAQLMARKDGEDNYNLIQDFSKKIVSKLAVLAGECD